MSSTIESVDIYLRGRSSILRVFTDEDGTALDFDDIDEIRLRAFNNPGAALADVLFTKLASDGDIMLTGVDGELFIDLSDNAAALNPQKLFYLTLELLDNTGAVVFAAGYYGLGLNMFQRTFSVPAGGNIAVPGSFSIHVVNTRTITAWVGGTGCLDGQVTVGQPVGCYLEFQRSGQPPEQWVLEVWTSIAQNTDPGGYQQGLDFNASTNAKVWRRVS